MQPLKRHFTQDVAEVEIGFGDLLDVGAAYFADIALVAFHRIPRCSARFRLSYPTEADMSVLDRFRLHGKTGLINGGSRGLGLEMARALGEAGANLVLVGRETATLQKAVEELSALKRRVATITADIGIPDEAERMCREALEGHSPIDILINNVGG